MSRWDVDCSSCGKHIGYVYSSMPIGPLNCVECGDAEREQEGQEEKDDYHCPECGTPGCQGHCAGDDMMGSE